jgi:hypothetical protein
MDVVHVLALVDAVHGADLNAGLVLDADAGLGDDERHVIPRGNVIEGVSGGAMGERRRSLGAGRGESKMAAHSLTALAVPDSVSRSLTRHGQPMNANPPDLSSLRIDRSAEDHPRTGGGARMWVIVGAARV